MTLGVLAIPVEPSRFSVDMLIWKQAGSSDNSAEGEKNEQPAGALSVSRKQGVQPVESMRQAWE